jgi:hypothetical protein
MKDFSGVLGLIFKTGNYLFKLIYTLNSEANITLGICLSSNLAFKSASLDFPFKPIKIYCLRSKRLLIYLKKNSKKLEDLICKNIASKICS